MTSKRSGTASRPDTDRPHGETLILRRLGGRLGPPLALAAVLSAAPAWADTLTGALTSAYQNNPKLAAARANLRGKDEAMPQALAAWLPRISGSASDSSTLQDQAAEYYNDQGSDPSNPRSHTRTRSLGLDGDLNLYNGGQTSAEISFAKASILAERAVLANTEQQVLLDATHAYVTILFAQERLEAAIEDEHSLEEIKKQVDQLYATQHATVTEAAEVDAELAEARARREQVIGDLEVARSQYNAVVGKYPTDIKDWPELPPVATSLAAARKLADQDNPQIIAARETLTGNQASVDQARGTFLPTINLNVSYDRTFDNGAFKQEAAFDTPYANYKLRDYQSALTIGIKLTIPLYDGGNRSSVVREHLEAVSASKSQVEDAERTVDEQVTANWSRLQAARAQIIGGDARLQAAETALKGERYKYNNGNATIRDLLQAQQKYVEAILSKTKSRYDAEIAQSNLIATYGQYNARDLKLPVAIYDPVKHYDDVRISPW